MKTQPISIETIDSKVLNLAMNDFIWHQVEEFFPDNTDIPVQGINLVEYTADTEQALQQKISRLIDQSATEANSKRIGLTTVIGKASVDKIWAMRKRAVGLLGNGQGEERPIPFVEDTAVPPEHLADFILDFRELLDGYQLTYGMFGHVDAGVLHVRPALDMKDPEQEKMAWEISDRVADLCHQYHGILWGEHGKGVRSEYAPLYFGELYTQLQRIKATFDPRNQLNPGKIATPDKNIALLKIKEVTTRGSYDRQINPESWQQYPDAVHCNGNGTCFNWNTNDPMCPSWKATRDRTQSPKGRASLIKEWLRLISKKSDKSADSFYQASTLTQFMSTPARLYNSYRKRRGDYDFSNEVYQSMATCLACKSCAGQCPIKVNVPEFRSQFLAAYHTRYARPLKDYLVGSLEFILPFCSKIHPIYNVVMNLKPITYLLDKLLGFVDGPKLSGLKIDKKIFNYATDTAINNLTDDQLDNTVIIVQDAFTRYFETQVVIDTYNALTLLGFNPLIAPYHANGKPLHVHGFLNKFRQVAQSNVKRLNRYAKKNIPLVGIDPSLTLTYRSEYKQILSGDVPEVHLLQEWLHTALTPEKISKLTINPNNTAYTLLPHCTEATNATAATQLWAKIFDTLGLTLTTQAVGCCGMSGTFGHESRNKATAKTIYAQSWKPAIESKIKDNDATSILATGYSCRCQVKLESNITLQHPIQVLLKSVQNSKIKVN